MVSLDRQATNIQSRIGFCFMVGIILFRYPNFLIHPRFWAEEALYYESFLRLENIWQSFNLLIYPSYYLFLNRLAATSATLVPIDYAPLVTSIFGFCVICLPLAIIFFTSSRYWASLRNKFILSFLYIFSATTGEAWMNSTNIGFLIPITMFLILVDDNLYSRSKRVFYYLLIFIGAISSPIGMIMAPLYFLRYFISRERTFAKFCIILCFAAAFQISYFITAIYFGVEAETRFDINQFDHAIIISNLIAFNFVFPLFGYFASLFFREFFKIFASKSNIDLSEHFTNYNLNIENLSPTLSYLIEILSQSGLIILYAILVGLILLIYRILKLVSLEKRVYFIFPYIYLSLVLNGASLGSLGGFRYSIITSFILLFFLFTVIIDFPSYKNYFIKFLLSFSIFIGFIEYIPRIHNYIPDTFVAEEIDWPDWREEVKKWRLNNNYLPRTWPSIKNKDFIYPARDNNESNITCINLNYSTNWEMMGSRFFLSSAKEIILSDKNSVRSSAITHYANCLSDLPVKVSKIQQFTENSNLHQNYNDYNMQKNYHKITPNLISYDTK